MTKNEIKLGIKRVVEKAVYSDRMIHKFYENPNDSIGTRIAKAEIEPFEFQIRGILKEFGIPGSRAYTIGQDMTLDEFEDVLLDLINTYPCPDCGRTMWSYTGENITEHSSLKALVNGGINLLSSGAIDNLLEVDTKKHVVYIACENCKHKLSD